MAVHRFSAIQRSLRDSWFGTVETCDAWEDLGPIGEGESASIRVCNNTDGMVGVAKPGLQKGAEENHCRAAHEKIAFDLSHLAALPVSTVVLWPEGMPGQYKRGRSISTWAFPEAMKWSVADRSGLISPTSKEAAGEIVSAMRVFHTWIGDQDRKGDHILIDLNSPEGNVNVAFIDHGHSMSLYWGGPNAGGGVCGTYLAGVPEIQSVMIETARHIAKIEDGEVERLVNRIPALYLPDAKRAVIIQNLLARKGNLQCLLGI